MANLPDASPAQSTQETAGDPDHPPLPVTPIQKATAEMRISRRLRETDGRELVHYPLSLQNGGGGRSPRPDNECPPRAILDAPQAPGYWSRQIFRERSVIAPEPSL